MVDVHIGVDTIEKTALWNALLRAKIYKDFIKERLTPTMEISLNTKGFDIKGNLVPEKMVQLKK